MKINKEEAVCILLAFLLVACQVAMVTAVDMTMEGQSDSRKALVQILGTICLSMMALAVLVRIPSSWHHQIVYDSTEPEESEDS